MENKSLAHPGWRHEDGFIGTNKPVVEVLTDGQILSAMMQFVDAAIEKGGLSESKKSTLISYVSKAKVVIDA